MTGEPLDPGNLRARVALAAGAIRSASRPAPKVGWIAPTGTAPLAPFWRGEARSPARSLPGFPASFEEAFLVTASLDGIPLAAFEGGPALHGGATPLEIGFPVWVLASLGVRVLLLTAGAGSLDPSLAPGEILLVRDHVNASGLDPLRGLADERLGPRFPDLSRLYDPRLRETARRAAAEARVPLREGAVAFRTGPSLDTPAERASFRGLGCLGVVHSLVPEAIAAAHAGTALLALAAVTDAAHAEALPPSVEGMAEASARALPRLGALLARTLREAAP
ncbi:MAG TPA: purine-nucleoside phosphorylase [Planctomycetota bacterium]|jgi:purine-nucleoside phosphorylase|nr:purine-nucleoside phosphorylase [Planctomycetota bacterium]